VQGVGCRAKVVGCRMPGVGCRVQGAGFGASGAGFRVSGVGCRVLGVPRHLPRRFKVDPAPLLPTPRFWFRGLLGSFRG
jgi:hypothetical protein